ncbi:hypothetical protein K439DRAFT_1639753 [Ramaria rubella]|nr:hypothetical protein K439DRAFT_1639753 [Ramaria rubella]
MYFVCTLTAHHSLSIVACSNGVNGLLTKGFTTFDSLPTFTNIGVIDIDITFTGFNITKFGRINVTAMRVPASLWLHCELTDHVI